MNQISRAWTPAALSNLRSAINGENLFQSAQPSPESGDVLILAPAGGGLFQSDHLDLAESLHDQGVEVQHSIAEVGCAAKVSPDKAVELQDRGFQVVDNSARNLLPTMPAMPSHHYNIPTVDAVHMTGADALHRAGATGRGEVVAVLDSGADNPALAPQILRYRDFADNLSNQRDGAGHGTHILGDVHSTAPEAQFVVGRVMGDDGAGRPSDILRGLRWINDLKHEGLNITVLNMSMGGTPDGLPEKFNAIDQEIDKLSALGVKVVTAAGNEGPGEHTIGAPGNAMGAITIGSAPDRSKVSDFSSRGPTDDGVEKPDVVAPGEFISATVPHYSEMYRTAEAVQKLRDMEGPALKAFLTERPQVLKAFGLDSELLEGSAAAIAKQIKSQLPPTGLTEDDKVSAPGTSFAAPLAAGILASLNSYRHLEVEEARQLLKTSADPIPGYSHLEQGGGFINAVQALRQLQEQKKAGAGPGADS